MADKIPLTPEIVNTLVDKITKFSETIGEFKFYPYQIDFSKRITRSLLLNEGVSLTALFARQSGKSHTVAATMAANMELLPFLAQKYDGLEMYEKGFWVGIFAPVSEQAETMFGKIYDIITTETGKEILTGELRMPIPARGGGRGNIIKLMNGSLARMHSANRRAKINSKTYHVILLDEVQDVEHFVVSTAIGPMGAATNATLILTGTPAPVIGFFYDQINLNKSKDVKTNTLQQTHFEADCNIVKKYNPMYSKYIEKESKRLSPDSDEFLMSYMLIWPISKGMLFTKALLEEKCYNRSLGIVTHYRKTPCVAGLDIGKSLDSTILTILKQDYSKVDEEGNMEKTILDWLFIEGDDWESQYPQIVEKLSDYWVETLIVDSTGVGDPVRERIAFMAPEITVAPFVFSPSTKDIGYKYLIKEINAGRLLIPHDSATKKTKKFRTFEHQMCSLMKNYSGKFLNPGPVDKAKGHDDACLSEDTEILTARGFVGIDDMKETDLVVNYNLDKTLTYSTPKRIIRKQNTDGMVSLEGPYISQLLTEDHKIIYDSLTSRTIEEKKTNFYHTTIGKAQDLVGWPNKTTRILTTGKQSCVDFPITDEEIKIAGWMIAEGWVTQSKKREWNDARYQIGQSSIANPEHVVTIDCLVDKLCLDYNRYLRKDGLVMWQFRKSSKKFFDNLLPEGVHTIPRKWLSYFSIRQLYILYSSLMDGDGAWSRHTYTTVNEKLANDFQELTFRIGKQSLIKFRNKPRLVRQYKNGVYDIYVRNEHLYGSISKVNKVINYSGRVWCVEVDSGFIVIKRNGTISVTGNCDSLMLAVYATFFDCMPTVEEDDFGVFSNNRMNYSIFGSRYSRPRRI